MGRLRCLISELRRRNTFRAAGIYVVAAWVAVQVASLVFPAVGIPDSSLLYVWLIALFFFPLVIAFAWRYDLSATGLTRTPPARADDEFDPRLRRTDYAILAVLSVVAILIGWQLTTRVETISEVTQSAPNPNSIAVLPFENLTGDPAQEYFSDGISEELLSVLARIPEIRVISRTSAFSYKDRNAALTEIADELNVGHILDGSVRWSGDRVRITAQLVHVQSETPLWTNTFDRQFGDIFEIQDEIAAAVVDQLQIQVIGTPPRVRETSPEAYALYLQGQHLARQITGDDLLESNELFQQALALDPDYAPAWDGVANNYVFMAGYGFLPIDEGFRLASEAIEVALAIDPELAHAYALRGRIARAYENDLAAAAWNYTRALELDPTHDDNIRGAAVLLNTLGKIDQAIMLSEFVVQRDPVNPISHSNLGTAYHFAARWDDAIEACGTALRFARNQIGAHYCIGEALLFGGDAQAALAAFQAETLDALRLTGSAMAYQAIGRPDQSDEALAELIDKHAEGWSAQISIVYDYRNEPDKAFEWLKKAVEYRDPGISEILAGTLYFSNLRNDPRWLPFLETIGYAPHQLAAIEFDVTLPVTHQ